MGIEKAEKRPVGQPQSQTEQEQYVIAELIRKGSIHYVNVQNRASWFKTTLHRLVADKRVKAEQTEQGLVYKMRGTGR